MTFPLMIFAAGFGTRMRTLTQDRPKPLINVAGRSLLDRTLDLAAPFPGTPIVVNTHYKGDMIADHLTGHAVTISHESPTILDTGGGLRAALPYLGAGPVMTSNSDAVWHGPNPLDIVSNGWTATGMDALMLCLPLERCIGRTPPGDVSIAEDGHVTFGGDYVYGGIQILRTDRLAQIEDVAFSLKRIWTDMVRDNRLFAIEYPGWWCDVGHPEGLALAEDLIRHGPD